MGACSVENLVERHFERAETRGDANSPSTLVISTEVSEANVVEKSVRIDPSTSP